MASSYHSREQPYYPPLPLLVDKWPYFLPSSHIPSILPLLLATPLQLHPATSANDAQHQEEKVVYSIPIPPFAPSAFDFVAIEPSDWLSGRSCM